MQTVRYNKINCTIWKQTDILNCTFTLCTMDMISKISSLAYICLIYFHTLRMADCTSTTNSPESVSYSTSTEPCYSIEDCLYDYLMTSYNAEVRPATGPYGTVDVDVSISLQNILSLNSNIKLTSRFLLPAINQSVMVKNLDATHLGFSPFQTGLYQDEKHEVLSTVLTITAKWTDSYLFWNVSDFGIDQILINVKNLWLPDFAVVNVVDKFYQATFLEDFRAHIKSTGTVVWKFGGIFKTTCNLNIKKYPFDTQICYITIQNWAYVEKLVNLTTAVFDVGEFPGNSIWTLTDSSVIRESYEVHQQSYPRLKFVLNLERKPEYYIFNIILPSVLVLICAMGVFWLPPACGEKISLGITVMLAFTVFQIVITSSTPVNSDSTPLISKLMMSVMGLATLSTSTSMITVYLHFKGSTKRVPKWLRHIAFLYLARLFWARDEIPTTGEETVVPMELYKTTNESHGSIDISTTTESPALNIHNEHDTNSSSNQQNIKQFNNSKALLTQLNVISSVIKDQQRESFITNEWKFLAKIIDRILFFIAVIILVILIVVVDS